MKNPLSNYSAIAQVIIVLVCLTILTIIISLWIKHHKEALEEESMIALGKESGLSTSPTEGAAVLVNAIEKEKLKKAQEALKSFKPIPIADKIYSSLGSLQNDDENSIYTALGSLKNKLELAELNIYFNLAYKKTLLNFLQEHLDSAELSKVYSIVSKLKPY